jgi:hypothetical protein
MRKDGLLLKMARHNHDTAARAHIWLDNEILRNVAFRTNKIETFS